MAYIDFRLYFMGGIGRPDLANRFGVAPAGVTRDLALYREIAPQNIEFDGSSKIYRRCYKKGCSTAMYSLMACL